MREAPGPLNSFSRIVFSGVVIFDAKSLTPIFTKPLYFQKISDPDSYFTYSGLLEDLPHAVNALDEAAMSLVPKFGEALKAADDVAKAIPTTSQASKSE
ncbi:hypothetical protein [Robbsia sp. KACC 23696]|uniref:hypothetical protein n=1 Tax=Robbsia sp. KACC 23696 TaxID=3149231 RepID=UPI00325B86EA